MSETPESISKIMADRMKSIPYVETEEMFSNDDTRRREIDNMYRMFTEIMSKPVILQWQDFQKFLPLFCKEKRFTINPMNPDEVGPYYNLSMELIRLINPYKEFQVVFPDGQETITFPPIFTPVGQLSPEQVKAVDIFQNINSKCPDQPWKLKAAAHNLIAALVASQHSEVIQYQTKKFEQQATVAQAHILKKQGRIQQTSTTTASDDDVELQFD